MTTLKALRRLAPALLTTFAIVGVGASPALAETHPFLVSFGSFTNPNGIAIDESSGDVYVADIGTGTVQKFDANGNPVDFSALHSNTLAGSATPAGSFSFPEEPGNPAAIAVDNSTSPSDPSAGDLYVLDAGHDAIDKFSPNGSYLNQIGVPEPRGFGIDSNGYLRVYVNVEGTSYDAHPIGVDVFDDSAANRFVAGESNGEATVESGMPTSPDGYGFAVGPTGDDYLLYEECSCMAKVGSQLATLGRIDGEGSGDVALAADSATGHIYADDQSSISEWDAGSMNESPGLAGTGTLVSSFGSLELSSASGQGGIAVNGASGEIYVSNPADGKVYVFGSDVPAVTAGVATSVTNQVATLNGTVDPRGAAVTSCQFEYGASDEYGQGAYDQSEPCKQTLAQIGSGTSPVAVSAGIEGLQPGLLYHFRLNAGSSVGSSPSGGLFATPGLGFGIKGFEVEFLNENGTPDTQAGSHPFELLNNISFNSRYLRTEVNADSPYVLEPSGTVKDLTVDLPAGVVGNPNATAEKCTLKQLGEHGEGNCPLESTLGLLKLGWSKHVIPYGGGWEAPAYNITPPRGVAVEFGANFVSPFLYINSGVRAGGDYPVQATIVNAPPEAPALTSSLTIHGVVSNGSASKAFLTLPTGCHGPLRSTISADSYQEPGHFVNASTVTHNATGAPVALTGCSKLLFPPEISVSPDVPEASSSSGLNVHVHVPQTAAQNPEGLAESALRDTTVTLPEGVAINPAGADGLEACSESLAGFTGFTEFNSEFEPGVQTATFTPELPEPLQPGTNFCPNGSKIGTVKIKTPLLEHELEGSVYLAAQSANPFGSLLAMYLIVEDPVSGSLVKLTGEVRLSETGQIVTTFKNTPDLPFEELELHFFGGERAPLATPSRCGTYTTSAVFAPWDGNGPVTAESSFKIEHGPNGGPCPGATRPFNPTVNGGATNIQAGAFSPLTVTMSRKDGEQNLKSIEAKLPPGLSGVLTGIELCPEPQANEGLCGENSKIGEATISVGVGNDPFTVTGGRFYLTGPYNGRGSCTVGEAGCAPFGITFEVPAKAGPFDLANTKNNHPACDCVVVRGKIELNPLTAAITIISNPPGSPDSIPTSIEGIPLEIQHVNATTTRGDFQFNPTNCSKMAVVGTVQLSEGGTSTISTPFQVTNCASLGFAPKFAVSTSAKTSRVDGASLSVKLTYPSAPFGSQANIKQVKVELPKQLPSRLPTLQKACTAAQFDANPAGCPAASIVGYGKAITPLVPVPLEGPAYFVSNGGAAFPDLIVVLQGYGVTIDLVGDTFISKAGVTSSTFKTVPDAPVGSFELNLPEGKYSALAALGNLCKQKLTMPTEFIAQNGAELHQTTKIAVTGCPKAKKTTHKKKKRKAKGHKAAAKRGRRKG